jgi:uncharacterized protein with HEPN domain
VIVTDLSADVAGLLDDIRQLLGDSARIVTRGKDRFFDPGDRTARLAAKAIVIDLQRVVERLPAGFRAQHPDVAWDELRAMRNYLALDEPSTDYAMVWNALGRDFPILAEQLGL